MGNEPCQQPFVIRGFRQRNFLAFGDQFVSACNSMVSTCAYHARHRIGLYPASDDLPEANCVFLSFPFPTHLHLFTEAIGPDGSRPYEAVQLALNSTPTQKSTPSHISLMPKDDGCLICFSSQFWDVSQSFQGSNILFRK